VEVRIAEKGRRALVKALPARSAAQEQVVAVLGKKRWSALIGKLEEVAGKLTKS
jgi:hypothetical protein